MGDNQKLVWRTCRCGCGLRWRTLKKSRNFYASQAHNPKPADNLHRGHDNRSVRRVRKWLDSLYGRDPVFESNPIDELPDS